VGGLSVNRGTGDNTQIYQFTTARESNTGFRYVTIMILQTAGIKHEKYNRTVIIAATFTL